MNLTNERKEIAKKMNELINKKPANKNLMSKFLVSHAFKQAINFENYSAQIAENKRISRDKNAKELVSPFSLPARNAGLALAKIWSDLYTSGEQPVLYNTTNYFNIKFTAKQFCIAYGLEPEQIGLKLNFNRAKKKEAIAGLVELSEFAVIIKTEKGLKAQALCSFGIGDNSNTLNFNGYTSFFLHKTFLADKDNKYFILPPNFSNELKKVYPGRKAKDVLGFLLFVASLKSFNENGYKISTVLREMELTNYARRKKYVLERIIKAIEIATAMKMIESGNVSDDRIFIF